MLTELAVQSMKPRAARYMKADREGLYLEVVPAGHKYWWFVERPNGKRKKTPLGKWPDVSLKQARELLAVAKRKAGIASFAPEIPSITFEEVAREWYKVRVLPLAPSYSRISQLRLDKYVLPPFMGRTLDSVTGTDVLRVCRDIENKGLHETAHRVLNMYSQIFRFAMPFYIQGDPTAGLVGKLSPVKPTHFARVTDRREVSNLMCAVKLYPRPRVRNALLFSAYTFARPGEVRHAEWSEFDFMRSVWRVPPEKMKMRREHVVPLSKQVLTVLSDQRSLLESCGMMGRYVFPSERGIERSMSENTVRLAIRALGFGADEMTAHGFRGMASTLLNESGLWSVDAIELQLAHVDENSVRAAYNDALLIPERTKLMQWYADELDRLGEL